MTILSALQFVAEDKESRKQLLEGDKPTPLPEVIDTARTAPAPILALQARRIEVSGKAVEIKIDDD